MITSSEFLRFEPKISILGPLVSIICQGGPSLRQEPVCGPIGSREVDVVELLKFLCTGEITWSVMVDKVSGWWVINAILVSFLVVVDFGGQVDGDFGIFVTEVFASWVGGVCLFKFWKEFNAWSISVRCVRKRFGSDRMSLFVGAFSGCGAEITDFLLVRRMEDFSAGFGHCPSVRMMEDFSAGFGHCPLVVRVVR